LPIFSHDTEHIDDKVGDINEISQMFPNCDLNNRSDHVWSISLDPPTSDDFDHDEVDDAETNTRDLLNVTLSPYNVVKL